MMTEPLLKHLRSRARDLREIFDKSVLVRHIAVFELQTCSAHEDARAVRSRMDVLDMDAFPMTDDGRIIGYVLRDRLGTGPCSNFRLEVGTLDVIPESETMMTALEKLRDSPRVFVTYAGKIIGIVTRGDLQKAPVRMLLFGLVTLLEMQLLRLVKAYYPNDSWKTALSPTRLKAAERVQTERRSRNEALGLIDCLQFADKRDLILQVQELRDRLRMTSRSKGEKDLKSIEDLRDRLAHGQDLVSGTSWSDLIGLSERVESLLEECEAIADKAG